MIDVESPNNAILERSWIHMIKVVTSSCHQLLRYPTLIRTADIRGDRAMSKSIVVIAQKKSERTVKNMKVASKRDHLREETKASRCSIAIKE